MTDFSAIDNILVTFGSHQEADAQKQLIDSYGGFLDELDPLFTDPINKDTLKADVVDQIKALIIKELIVPVAIDTDDLAIIASIVRECPFKVSHSGLPSTRLTKTASL
jgi:vacuolar-type H+-ATPase subunit E/Vma4